MKRKALGKGLSALLPDPDGSAGPGDDTAAEVPIDAPRSEPAPAAHRPRPRAARGAGGLHPRERDGPADPRAPARASATRSSPASGAGAPRSSSASRRCPSPSATCPTSACSSWRSWRTSSARSSRPLEEAQAFQRLQEELQLTQEEVARSVGRDRSTVANTLRLLRLPRERARARWPRARSTPGTAAPCSPSSAPRTRWRSRGRPRARAVGARGGAAGRRCCAPRAAARKKRPEPTRAPRRSGCAPRSGPGWRSRGGARGGQIRIALRERGGAQAALRALVRPARAAASGRPSPTC